MLQHIVRLIEQVATCGYQLGTLGGQPQAPSHMIEKPNTKLSLQILQPAGEGGLRNTQCLCCAGDGALFSHNNKCSQSPEVHCLLMLRKHQFADQLCIGSMEGSMPYPAHRNISQERNKTMSLQINDVALDFDATDFEGVRPDLLDLVQGTTACSSTVFYGLLAWANLQARNLANAHT